MSLLCCKHKSSLIIQHSGVGIQAYCKQSEHHTMVTSLGTVVLTLLTRGLDRCHNDSLGCWWSPSPPPEPPPAADPKFLLSLSILFLLLSHCCRHSSLLYPVMPWSKKSQLQPCVPSTQQCLDHSHLWIQHQLKLEWKFWRFFVKYSIDKVQFFLPHLLLPN